MLDIFVERYRQKMRTVPYPKGMPSLPPRLRGRPLIDAGRCRAANGKSCALCAQACPTQAISIEENGPVLDMGVCTFCGACALACEKAALIFTTDWRLGATSREELLVRPQPVDALLCSHDAPCVFQSLPEPAPGAKPKAFALSGIPAPLITPRKEWGAFKRSFRLRQVSAAGCGACEADLNVLGTVVFDLGRFGIDFVASPRHADALVITGPVPRNMREALAHCDAATPAPRAVIAVGACAISGGLFRALPESASYQQNGGAEAYLPVDLYIPGCPPHPYTNLDAMLRFLGVAVPGD